MADIRNAVGEKDGPIASAGGESLSRPGQAEDPRGVVTENGVDVDRAAPEVDGASASAFDRATKPEAESCCGPSCCA